MFIQHLTLVGVFGLSAWFFAHSATAALREIFISPVNCILLLQLYLRRFSSPYSQILDIVGLSYVKPSHDCEIFLGTACLKNTVVCSCLCLNSFCLCQVVSFLFWRTKFST